MLAAQENDHQGVVRALLQARANPHVKTELGVTALSIAEENGNSKVCAMLKHLPAP